MPSISVVMATYNGQRFIREQLESFARQSRLPDELYVSDDGSQDATLEIVQEFAARAPFPVVVHRNAERLGYADNFLHAAAGRKTDLIAFSDQDDIWHPDKLRLCCEAFSNPSVVMCAHPVDLIDADSKPIGHFTQGISADATLPPLSLDPWGTFWGFTITIRRSLLDLVPFRDRGLDNHELTKLAAHDRFVSMIANAVGETALIAQPLALYRQHGSNLFGPPRLRLGRVTLPLDHITEKAAAYTQIAAHRSTLFERAASRVAEGELRSRLLDAAQMWARLSEQSARRTAVYREPLKLRRAVLVAQNLAASVYQRTPTERFAASAFLKDVVAIVK
jgi:glycosyltransferase involved in cell wall biosynthesis